MCAVEVLRLPLSPMLATYIIGCVALIIKPGPDLMCTLATAISDGKVRATTLMDETHYKFVALHLGGVTEIVKNETIEHGSAVWHGLC